MPIGDLNFPIIGKNVVIAVLVQTHILFAAFIIGAVIIAATSEYLGMITKQPRYERFARNVARFVVLLFASGAALAITFVLALVTLDRKSTRLNSSHANISYAVFCLKKKKI